MGRSSAFPSWMGYLCALAGRFRGVLDEGSRRPLGVPAFLAERVSFESELSSRFCAKRGPDPLAGPSARRDVGRYSGRGSFIRSLT